ncbi:dTDP-4-dehydrorhamnose 3,5-epimerase [Plastorhodobacter daqingensis]|uniref:dTDP-4-dehydrorhamnose 3,5-epimerase n=1 Tax=Plastorhodobacter daqingensis TaxID=1387281 RepID=A0ABW2UJ87_9RHOB
MKIEETALAGVLLLTMPRHVDPRGHFSESWSQPRLAAAGIDIAFVQDNESLSRRAGTVRGLHYQAPPAAQAKLVRVAAGVIWDVAVDIRRGSPSFGRWVGAELSAENGRQMLIPEGFLHGFVTRAPDTLVLYKCSRPYAPECDRAVRFDDPDLGIDWGIAPGRAILSDKDAAAPTLRDAGTPFDWAG